MTHEQLCTLAKETVDNSIMIFRASTMFVNQVMSRIQFNDEINETLNRFKRKIPILYARTLDIIRTTLQGNALMSLFSSNWNLVVAETGKGKNASFRSVPVSYVNIEQNTSCSCATSRTCTIPAQIFRNMELIPYYTLEGIVLGCYSFETVLLSSLSCFYSIICIKNLRGALGLDRYGSNQANYSFVHLNALLTRFNINDTVETMAYEMFIESWTSNVSYERFFNSCSPNYCTYTFHYRFDTLELLTTFLSTYAGLSIAVRFIVPYLIKIIKKIRNRFCLAST